MCPEVVGGSFEVGWRLAAPHLGATGLHVGLEPWVAVISLETELQTDAIEILHHIPPSRQQGSAGTAGEGVGDEGLLFHCIAHE